MLFALVRALLPEGKRKLLRHFGITELPLDALNTLLAPHGLVIRADREPKSIRSSRNFVRCVGKDGRAKRYDWFELRQIPQEAPGRTHERRR